MAVTPNPTHRHSQAYRQLLHHSRTLHTYLSMLAVVLFFFFGATGFMLNHAEWFGLDKTTTHESTVTIPQTVLEKSDKLLLVEFLRSDGHITGAVQSFDWPAEGDPFHLAFKSPRSQVDVDITLPSGEAKIVTESRGIAGLMSRLHTARDAGAAWQWLVDATAVLLILASLTGLVLWQSLPKRRTLGMIAFAVSIVAVGMVYWMCVP